MSMHVERVFSKGQILFSHLHNCQSVQSTRALLCVGTWSLLGYVKLADIKPVTKLPEEGKELDNDVAEGWDSIDLLGWIRTWNSQLWAMDGPEAIVHLTGEASTRHKKLACWKPRKGDAQWGG